MRVCRFTARLKLYRSVLLGLQEEPKSVCPSLASLFAPAPIIMEGCVRILLCLSSDRQYGMVFHMAWTKACAKRTGAAASVARRCSGEECELACRDTRAASQGFERMHSHARIWRKDALDDGDRC